MNLVTAKAFMPLQQRQDWANPRLTYMPRKRFASLDTSYPWIVDK